MAATQTSRRPARWTSPAAHRFVAWILPSLADVIFVVALFGVVFILQGRALGLDGDIGWHIRLGLRTLSGDLPRADTFSSTAYGRPLVGMEWLAEVGYAAVWRLGGLNAVVALAGLLIAFTAASLLTILRAHRVPLLLAVLLTLLALALTSIHWVARPHLFSFPLTLWWSEWVWRYWRDGERRRLWWFPVVMVVWVNLHGGFLAGLILLGTAVAIAWLFPHARGLANPTHLSLAFAACLVATMLTPWGLAWPGYFAAYFADPLVPAYTQELQSPDFHTLFGRLFLALLLLLVAAWVFAVRSEPPSGTREINPPADTALHRAASAGPEPLAWATAGIWTILACTAVRAVPLWALVVAPILGEALARWLGVLAQPTTSPTFAIPDGITRPIRWMLARSMRLDDTERQVGRGLWGGLAALFVVTLVLSGGRLPGRSQPVLDVQFSSRDFPVAAVARLRQTGLPAGNGFNTAEWGGYLIYALPNDHVFIDSRSDFYGQAILRDYLTVLDVAPGWQQVVDRYHVRWALLPRSIALAQALALSPSWACTPMDRTGVAVLCVRHTAPGP